MNVLVDSHILLWSAFEPEKLSSNLIDIIGATDNIVSVSIVSMWEIAIKQSVGKLSIPESFHHTIYHESSFNILPVYPAHIEQYTQLPLLHRDPFDRMLVAQAQHEKLIIATHDPMISKYDVQIVA